VPTRRAVLFVTVTTALCLALLALGRRAWVTVGEIEQALAEADAELALRD
jgi:hypothetical protein